MILLRKHERVLDLSPKPKETKAKVDKWHPVKLSFCTEKETFDKTKQNKKTTRMGQYICEWYDQQKVNIQNT